MVLPTTRLNKKIRRDILNRLLMHRFGPELRALAMESSAIADHVFENTFTHEERDLLKKIPKEWIGDEDRIEVQVGGERHVIQFNGTVYWREEGLRQFCNYFDAKVGDRYRRMPDKYKTWKVDGQSAIGRRVLEAEAKRGAIESQFRTAVAAAKSTLGSYNTIGTLAKSWPEVEPFLPKTEEQVRVPAVALPVISNDAMNSMLRLPVEEEEVEGKVVPIAGR